jgi:hypothetical protein
LAKHREASDMLSSRTTYKHVFKANARLTPIGARLAVVLSCCLGACQSSDREQGARALPASGPAQGAAGIPANATAAARAGVGAAAGGGASAALIAASGRDGASGTAGVGGGQAGSAAPSGAAGDAGGHARDHCLVGQDPDPRSPALPDVPDQWKASNADVDLVVPKTVLDWMHTRIWEQSHDAWHNVRRCRGSSFPGAMQSPICSHSELIAAHPECSDAEDGYQFLVMHRHMLQSLRQAFPQQPDQFAGFAHFPFDAKDVPEIWRGRWGSGWSQSIKDTATTLEDIEHKLSQFPSEGDLGRFIQCGSMGSGASSIHGALHFKWVVNESPYSLGKQTVNIDNYMFWKLHGWIDQIWERYRVAKGLTPAEPKLVQALVDQCHEMHALAVALDPAQGPDLSKPLPVEHGEFHEHVRPILEKICSSCHSESSPEAGMSLGGHISSADVVKGLLNVPAMHGGQFKRIVPKQPDQSWLYLKVAGMAMNAGCMGSTCNAQVMPPTGQVTLSTTDLNTLRQWIVDGAPAPTP